jgi:hypothetical protein
MVYGPYADLGSRERRWIFGLFAVLIITLVLWKLSYIPFTVPLIVMVALGLANYQFTRERAEESILNR